jgi:hypothetical protein
MYSTSFSNGSTSSNEGFISTLSDEEILKDMDHDDFMIFQMCWQWLVTPMKFSLCMR